MAHAVVAFYIALESVGLWIAVVAFLYYRRIQETGFLYFSLFAAGVVTMLGCEILLAYADANRIILRPGAFWTTEAIHGAGQLVYIFAVVRLAFSIVRLRMSRAADIAHLAGTAAYAILVAIFLLRRWFFQTELIALGASFGVSLLIVIRNRRRILSPMLRRALVQFAVIELLFAPAAGLSVFTGLADYLPLGRMAFQAASLLIAEVLIAYYAVRLFFGHSSQVEPLRHPETMHEALSAREREIVGLVRNGYTNPEIGEMLGISPRTVTNHLYNIYRKIDVRNRVELINEVAAGE